MSTHPLRPNPLRTIAGSAAVAALGVVALTSLGRAQERQMALALGQPIPMADVAMKSVDGRSVSIADVKGPKGTLVIFTCNHCPFVKAWETRTVALGNEWIKRGIGVIAINSNDPGPYPEDDFPGMQQRAKERGVEYPYVVDSTSEVARAFGASRTPEAFLFDKSGKLVYHGAIDDNMRDPERVKARYLADALQAVASAKPVRVPETKFVGCSIKYRANS
jgi:peroxiredoxin